MDWLAQSYGQVLDLTWRHLILAGLPLLIGLAVALPLGYAAHRWRAAYAPLVTISGLLYTIPSLALFILMPLFIQQKSVFHVFQQFQHRLITGKRKRGKGGGFPIF
jgi:osmoprotectant transport system permease protein